MRGDEPFGERAQILVAIIRPTCVGMNRPIGAAGGGREDIRPTCVGMNRPTRTRSPP